MDLMDKLSDIENFGIDLKLKTVEEQELYCRILFAWLQEKGDYQMYFIDSLEFGVDFYSPTMERNTVNVYFQDSAIRFNPLEGDPYFLVLDVLEFVAKKHQDILEILAVDRSNYNEDSEAEIEDQSEDDSDEWEWV